MPAPTHTPATYSPAADRIFKQFAQQFDLSLEELILKEINDNGRTIRDLAPKWGCSVSLLSQIMKQLGISISRYSKAELHPRAKR